MRRTGARRRWVSSSLLAIVLGTVSQGAQGASPPSEGTLTTGNQLKSLQDQPARAGGSPEWLTWSLAGLGTASVITAVTAWQIRETYAARWNSAECIRSGQTRIQVCPYDFSGGQDAGTVAWVSGVTALVTIGGAVTSWILQDPGPAAPTSVGLVCGVSGLGAACSGSF